MNTGSVRIGVIGAGDILGTHLEGLRFNPEYRLTGLCGLDRDQVEDAARASKARAYTDYRDLLADRPDVVSVNLPHHLHAPVCLDALRAGCHCLVEKPLAISLDDLRRMRAAAAAAGKALMVAESSYWEPVSRAIRERVADGALGEFVSGMNVFHRVYFNPGRPAWFLEPAKSGGGMLINVGVHHFAAIRCMLGDAPEEIAVTAAVQHPDPEKTVEAASTVMVVYGQGAAMCHENFGHFKPPDDLHRGFHLVFSRGIVGVKSGSIWIADRNGHTTYHGIPALPPGGTYGLLYRELLKAVRGDDHYPTALHGARDVRLALAAYASARECRSVDLSNVEWDL